MARGRPPEWVKAAARLNMSELEHLKNARKNLTELSQEAARGNLLNNAAQLIIKIGNIGFPIAQAEGIAREVGSILEDREL